MSIEFYIFRHGETDWNKERRVQGHTDIPMNELGIKQAILLSKNVKHLGIEVIYSSDLSRAHETAKIVNKEIRVKLEVTPLLREAHFGEAEGLLLTEIINRWGEEFWNRFKIYDRKSHDIGFPGGETRGASILRIRSLLDEIMTYSKYKKIPFTR